jgi:hypothetical protein
MEDPAGEELGRGGALSFHLKCLHQPSEIAAGVKYGCKEE